MGRGRYMESYIELEATRVSLDLVATVRRDPKQEHIDAWKLVVERLLIVRERNIIPLLVRPISGPE